MNRIPHGHRSRAHEALIESLAGRATDRFETQPGVKWDPRVPAPVGPDDLARGFFDAFAIGLHILWTYQEAWATEAFLGTARLPESADKLLAHLGYRGAPGTAAVGLQHFACRANQSGVLPRGFRVKAPALGATDPEVFFETLAPVRVDHRFNRIQAYRPGAAVRPTSPAVPLEDPGGPGAPSGGLFGRGSAVDGILDRLDARRFGTGDETAAIRAKIKARQLAGLMAELDPGDAGALEVLCEKLCESWATASQLPVGDARTLKPLSESQELVAKALGALDGGRRDALDALEGALARHAGEDAAAYGRRLDQMTVFVDALVGGLIREARDQIVLLRGRSALERLDRTFGGEGNREAPFGRAPAGTDQLFLPDDPPLEPGDWLVVAQVDTRTDAAGRTRTTTTYTEAVRVVRSQHETPAGGVRPMRSIHFVPPLRRPYRLDEAYLVGNLGLVSAGRTVEDRPIATAGQRVFELSSADPLTWIRDARARNGRRPEVEVTVAGREWARVDTLAGAERNDTVFAVEPRPGGGSVVRVGDGDLGASVPEGAALKIRYRVGLGATGNVASRRVEQLAAAHPAVEGTFNPIAFSGGTDPESFEDARRYAPERIGTMDRAVSAEDIETLARSFDGVDRARVVADPRRPRHLIVYVVTEDGAGLVPDELERLRTHLMLRVPPGVVVRAENRSRVEVFASLLLRIEPLEDPIAVMRAVRDALGETDTEGLLGGARVGLGEALTASRVYGALDGVPGLHSVVIRALHRAERRPANEARIDVRPGELLAWAAAVEGRDALSLAYEEIRDR